MSNGFPRPRVWVPGQRNEAPNPLFGLSRPFGLPTEHEQGYYLPSNNNDWEWTTTPTSHQVGPSYSHGGDYPSYGGMVLIQERRGPGPSILPRYTPMLNDHIGSSHPRLIMQPTTRTRREVSFPRQEDQTRRIDREEQKAMLSKLKKEVYYPKTSVRSLATRLSSFYRKDATSTLEEEEDDGKSSCVVCLEDFKPYENVMTTPCSHMFHEDCILPWMKSNGKCPVCRAVIYEKRNERLPTRDNNNQTLQIDAFELIALVRAMEESIGWG
ncbi:E3 ubiquitin-protein ligase RNF38-like [Impatiens glandulifera]|uniref:E3 ubiquitin-protein ligase RNF38-like n=1 Tax=Impatiens glandulifera TaxID=253017 RepID=UPI001FB144B3|nr:E3 ubiquitin-protein ligase RNF38-like [Impatiens glandulifera]